MFSLNPLNEMLVHATELLLGIMWLERVLFAHIAIL